MDELERGRAVKREATPCAGGDGTGGAAAAIDAHAPPGLAELPEGVEGFGDTADVATFCDALMSTRRPKLGVAGVGGPAAWDNRGCGTRVSMRRTSWTLVRV